jgi:solute carrier family 13 (sodium-dependent dicarboxylate transporter), member 2/3/5
MESIDPSPDFYPKRLGLAAILGCVAYALCSLLPFPAGTPTYPAQMAGAVTAFVATCWLSSALPLGAASLLPLPLLSMLGVLPLATQKGYGAATSYAHPILWMFFGGFILAIGIERWGLHKRIALLIISRFGVNPSRLVLGFMVASAFLSMWLMNTSTTLMLLPIAMALVSSMSASGALNEETERNFAFTLLLGIAYAASIGGTATPIGTAPNALYLSNYVPLEEAGAPKMTFLLWMGVGLPFAVLMVPLVWLLLTKVLAPVAGANPQAKAILDKQAQSMAPMDRAEKSMLALFVLAALMWTTRRDIGLGGGFSIPGWWNLMPVPHAKYIGDGSVAMFVALLAFVLPSGRRRGQALMDWEHARKMPWDIILLIGGGIAIAEAFRTTGLALAVGLALKPLISSLGPLALVILVSTAMTFLTEVTSNTAMTSLLLPILLAACQSAGIDARLLMLPATFSASCAFMLPIATPPNAIVFSSKRISMARMARVGFFVNLLGIVMITLLMWWVAIPLLGIEVEGPPTWLHKP